MLFRSFALLELGIDKNQKISAENKAKIDANLNAKIEAITDASSRKYFALFFKDLIFLLGKNLDRANNKNFNQNQKRPATSYSLIKSSTKSENNLTDAGALEIIALIARYPYLRRYRDEYVDIQEMNFANDLLTRLKDLLIERLEHNEKSQLQELSTEEFSKEIKKIEEILIKWDDAKASNPKTLEAKNNKPHKDFATNPKLMEERKNLYRYWPKEHFDDDANPNKNSSESVTTKFCSLLLKELIKALERDNAEPTKEREELLDNEKKRIQSKIDTLTN